MESVDLKAFLLFILFILFLVGLFFLTLEMAKYAERVQARRRKLEEAQYWIDRYQVWLAKGLAFPQFLMTARRLTDEAKAELEQERNE